MGKLYLIPTTLGDSTISSVIPNDIIDIIRSTKIFIVENIRTTRRFLKKCDRSIDIDSLTFYELNKHTDSKKLSSYLEPIRKGNDIGIISEAGCPGVADPGADVVKIAHRKGIKVIPLVGPSSILLAVMASGLNGQSFAFNGYIPIDKGMRTKTIKSLEHRSIKENQSQLFIETPYRNVQLLNDIVNTCSPNTNVTVACDITLESEYIKTATAKEWKGKIPEIHKRPTIFIIQG